MNTNPHRPRVYEECGEIIVTHNASHYASMIIPLDSSKVLSPPGPPVYACARGCMWYAFFHKHCRCHNRPRVLALTGGAHARALSAGGTQQRACTMASNERRYHMTQRAPEVYLGRVPTGGLVAPYYPALGGNREATERP